MSVTRAGVMDAFPNHTFQPAATLRRGDLRAGGQPGADADWDREGRSWL